MGFIDTLKGWKSALSKEVRVFNAGEEANINNAPFLPNWFWTAKLGLPRNIDFVQLRQLAKSAWVQMVINTITKQMSITQWRVVNSDNEDETDYSEDIERVTKLLKYPNRNGDNFWDVWGPYIRDVLELDAGVIWKGKKNGELKELFVHDGSRFLFDLDAHGVIEGYYQYSYRFPRNQPLFFEKDDIIYGQMNRNTEVYPYGWSPLQSIQQEVEIMIQSTRFNKEAYKNNAIPDGIITVPMDNQQMDRFKSMWDMNVKGKAHKLAFHNTPGTQFTDLRKSNTDMQWLEGQKWYFHICFGAYGVSPQEAGFYENSNRSTGESQERITVKNAILPYFSHIEEKINREIIPEITGSDNIKFEFIPVDDAQEKVEFEQEMQSLASNVITINEIRASRGLDPVEWGDQPMNMVMQDRFIDNTEGVETEEVEEDDRAVDDNDPPDNEVKPNGEKLFKDSEPIIEEEAKTYDEFLERHFIKWEKAILSSVKKTMSAELKKSVKIKTFGEFLSDMFNAVNVSKFYDGIKRVVKFNLREGVDQAEKELNVNIQLGEDFNQVANTLATRQIDGFLIDGKNWSGLKGVASDVQERTLRIVEDGIREGKSLDETSDNIKNYFTTLKGGKKPDGEMTEGRAMMIARTESNRMINLGKLQGYLSSGLKGKKEWISHLDDRTSPQCKRLNGRKLDLEKIFKDPAGEWMIPPAHPNCRSTVVFVPD